MMLPVVDCALRNCVMKDCDTTNALLRCDSIMASQADSGYRSNLPVSSAASAGEDPSPALFTRIDGVPKRATTSAMASSTAVRTVASTTWIEIGAPASDSDWRTAFRSVATSNRATDAPASVSALCVLGAKTS